MYLMSFVFGKTDKNTVEIVFEQLNNKSLPERLVEYVWGWSKTQSCVKSPQTDDWELLSLTETYGCNEGHDTGFELGPCACK